MRIIPATRIDSSVWITAVLASLLSMPCIAQVATDGSTHGGPPRVLGADGQGRIEIPTSLGLRAGRNLLHSFSEFSLGESETAAFVADDPNGSGGVHNLIARVTGSNPSQLFGRIESELSESRLIFINPNGVLFGSKFSTDLNGSLHVSTADRLLFSNGAAGISVRNPNEVDLVESDPTGLGFSSRPTGSISVHGFIETRPGRAISLVGNRILVEGNPDPTSAEGIVSALDGDIDLIAVDSTGTIDGLFDEAKPIVLSGFSQFGDIQLKNNAIISSEAITPVFQVFDRQTPPTMNLLSQFTDASGEPRQIAQGLQIKNIADRPDSNTDRFAHEAEGYALWLSPSSDYADSGSGQIQVAARNLLVSDSEIRSTTAGNRDGGAIRIDLTGDLEIERSPGEQSAGILAQAGHPIIGDLAVSVLVGTVRLEGYLSNTRPQSETLGPAVDFVVSGEGRGGAVEIAARNLRIQGGGTISTTSHGPGDGGDIRIDVAENVELSSDQPRNPSSIFSSAQQTGDAGSITIRALNGDVRLTSNGQITAQATDEGAAGDIDVAARRIEILNDSEINSSTTALTRRPSAFPNPAGAAGSVQLSASESIAIAHRRPGSDEFVGIRTFSSSHSAGDAGQIHVSAPKLRLDDLAEISASTEGVGQGGTVSLDIESLRLTRGASISATSVPQSGTPSSSGTELGPAGNIDIGIPSGLHRLSRLELRDDSSIVTTAKFGSPGNSVPTMEQGSIRIRSSGSVELHDDSTITASVERSRGGNVRISGADAVILQDRGSVLAESTGVDPGGVGGAIEIESGALFVSPGSEISADSAAGIAGQVALTSSIAKLEDDLRPIEAELSDSSSLLKSVCEARASGSGTSLFVASNISRAPAVAGLLRAPSHPSGILQPEEVVAVERLGRAVDLATSSKPEDSIRELSAFADDDKNADFVVLRAIGLANSARLEAERGSLENAGLLIHRARRLVGALDNSSTRWELRVHLSQTSELIASKRSRERDPWIALALTDLTDAVRIARVIDSPEELSAAAGRLARLYESEGYVDHALKMTRLAIEPAAESGAFSETHLWYSMQGRLLWRKGRVRASLESHRRAMEHATHLRGTLLSDFRFSGLLSFESLESVYLGYLDALFDASALSIDDGDREALLSEARRVVERSQVAELEDYFHDECLVDRSGGDQLSASLPAKAGASAAVVYPVAFSDRVELLVATPSGNFRVSSPVSSIRLMEEVERFRRALMDPFTRSHLREGRTLHAWLIEPILHLLREDGVRHLVWVPSGKLRNVPVAALHDGSRYLIQDFSITSSPAVGGAQPGRIDLNDGRVLLAGLSDPPNGYARLPQVEQELHSIRGMIGGELLVDGDFEAERLATRILEDSPTLVHIASHAKFSGDPNESYVLAHDRPLSFSDLGRYISPSKYGDRRLDLLVLSACETAAGDDRAALGLAGLAVRSGARSAVGSLWAVSDAETSELIKSFYQHLVDGTSSGAVALQNAQIDAIKDPARSHPFYWSAFLMVSGWI